MSKHRIHISDAEMEALAVTAALGRYAVEDLVGAAVWVFAQQDESFKEQFIRERWFHRHASPRATRPWRQILQEKIHGLARRIVSLIS
jgi:hypothetical protein